MFTQRQILNYYAKHSGAVLFDRFDGSIAPVSLDDDSVTRNIADNEIMLGDNKMAMWNYSYLTTKHLITEFDMYYKPIIPIKDGGWKGRVYARRTGQSDTGNLGSEASGNLQNAYSIINKERPMTVYMPGIRDESTAIELGKLLIKWRSGLLAVLKLTCNHRVLDIEFADKIGVTASIIPNFLSSKKWFVMGQRISPQIKTKKTKIELTLLELGGAQLPDTLEWIDTFATGTEKIDTFATGDIIQEVL